MHRKISCWVIKIHGLTLAAAAFLERGTSGKNVRLTALVMFKYSVHCLIVMLSFAILLPGRRS